jgi:hypothetical protein
MRDQFDRLIQSGAVAETDLELFGSWPQYRAFGTMFMNTGFEQTFELNDGGKLEVFAPAKEVFVNMVWHDPLEFERWAIQQITLASWLSAEGFNWIMFNAVHGQQSQYLTPSLVQALTQPRIYNPNWNWLLDIDRNYAHSRRACGHPAEDAHRDLARMLYMYMQTNALIA